MADTLGYIAQTFQAFATIEKIDDDTVEITGTGLGTGHISDPAIFYELTGVCGIEEFEGLQLQFDTNPDSNTFRLTGFSAAGVTVPTINHFSTTHRADLEQAAEDAIDAASSAVSAESPPITVYASNCITYWDALVAEVNAGNDYAIELSSATDSIDDLYTEGTNGSYSTAIEDAVTDAKAAFEAYSAYIEAGGIPGGMVRWSLPSLEDHHAGSMRIIFGHIPIDSLTTTGSTADEFAISNAQNSNRAAVHQMAGGSDHEMVATLPVGEKVNAIALLDRLGEDDALVNIQGNGENGVPVNVTYAYKSSRYDFDDEPIAGFAHDTTPHFIAYIPRIESETDTGSGEDEITITIINPSGGTEDIEFSELIIANYFQLAKAGAENFEFGSQMLAEIIANDSVRGAYLHRDFQGVNLSRTVTLKMLNKQEASMIDLLIKSKRTVIFDSMPNEVGERWRLMAVGYLTGPVMVENLRSGRSVELTVVNTKLHPGI